MPIKEAKFIKSSAKYQDCPGDQQPEYAFIGRSNVGKSSLINMICGRNSLAKTSGKPGKTQLINHFQIDEDWFLVDLPGYGWSKVSKKLKSQWGVMIEDYLLMRKNLACLFILVDSRHPPQNIDYDFITWVGEQQIPFAITFTKTDKLGKNQFQSVKAQHLRKLKSIFSELPTLFVTSSVDKVGGEEIIQFINEVNEAFRKNS